MKLLDAIKEIDTVDKAQQIKDTLEERLEWLEDREPNSFGEIYDTWSDKCDGISDILDILDEMISDDLSPKEFAQKAKNVSRQILSFQKMYGGLSRLIV